MPKNIRAYYTFPLNNFSLFKHQLLQWGETFSHCCFLDGNDYDQGWQDAKFILAAGAVSSCSIAGGGTESFSLLKNFCQRQEDWLFGHFSFELKNELFGIHSTFADPLDFPLISFFCPEIIFFCSNDQVRVGTFNDYEHTHSIITDIKKIALPSQKDIVRGPGKIFRKVSSGEYAAAVRNILNHIHRGDCYEINYCQEFFSDNAFISPLHIYKRLLPAPFSVFYRLQNKYLLSSSPERFISKQGTRIISQPMKGTIRRSLDKQEDEQLSIFLSQSIKERAENMIVVDLVRNDLSRTAAPGSVQVTELLKVYSFPSVHQLVSTVSSDQNQLYHFTDVIRYAFPMGSMTGAPKKRVLELINEYEKSARGLFSGSVGYITPEGDFDLNVVIRSILYDADTHYLSFSAGSGITFYSDIEKEWEECELKAASLIQILLNSHS